MLCVGTNSCPAAVSGVSPPAGCCLPLQMLRDCTNEHILIPPRLISRCPSALHAHLGEPSPVLPQLLSPPSLSHQHHLCSFLLELLAPGATSSPPQVPACWQQLGWRLLFILTLIWLGAKSYFNITAVWGFLRSLKGRRILEWRNLSASSHISVPDYSLLSQQRGTASAASKHSQGCWGSTV